jgi:hypothetical protein
MQYAVPIVSGGAPTSFSVPPGIMERTICSVSGAEPSQWCRGGQRTELFASDQPPLPPSQDVFRQVNIDTWTGLIAGDACKEFVEDELVMNVQDKWGREWLRSGAGRDWLEAHDLPRNPFFAPERECSASDPRPVIEFSNLGNGSVITETTFPIHGVIDVKNGGLSGWRLEYGPGQDPGEWTLLAEGANTYPSPSLIQTWDLQAVTDTQVTLRLYLMNGEENYAERKITITLNIPTPTPTITPSPTVTSFPPTETPTNTPEPDAPTAPPVEPATETPVTPLP